MRGILLWRISGTVLAILMLLLLAAGGVCAYLNSPSPGIPAGGSLFRVLKGESVSQVAQRLKQEKLIRSAFLLKLLSRFSGSESLFKRGFFTIKPGESTIEIHNLLISGYQEEVRLTFPEGWTLGRIAEHLEKRGVAPKREVLEAARSKTLLAEFGIPGSSLEGYLFPDTYFFPPNYPAQVALEQMVKNFFDHLERILPDYRGLDRRELHEKIIVASIVEREYRLDPEAPLIASVFYNRLKRNIGLESCATLEYIITEIQAKPHPQFIAQEDKSINSPYNTYKWAGLPPGPISNPGEVALRAAFHPAKTDYWYFLLKDPLTGEHYFSQDLREHNEAKSHYLKQVGAGG